MEGNGRGVNGSAVREFSWTDREIHRYLSK